MSDPEVVLITGSRKGVGLGLARHFLASGATVVGCSRKPTELQHANYEHHLVDIREERTVVELVGHVRSRFGGLRAVINNAGVAAMNHVFVTPMESVRRILETNVAATFLFCREAGKLLRKADHGRIVNISSVAVPLRLEGEAVYAASKAAVESLTRILAKELAPFGITCNAVGPGPVDTALIRGVPREKLDRVLARQAIHELTTLADIANVVDFFLRPESDFVTGQVIYLGGVS